MLCLCTIKRSNKNNRTEHIGRAVKDGQRKVALHNDATGRSEAHRPRKDGNEAATRRKAYVLTEITMRERQRMKETSRAQIEHFC